MLHTLHGTNILILGGSGFIGQNLAGRLLELGANVTVYDRVKPKLQGLHYIQGDLSEPEELRDIICQSHIIYHLISTTIPSTSNKNPIQDIQSNLITTLSILEDAISSKVNKIIFASSGGTVYGVPQHIPITEEHQTEPLCSYGIVKLSIEKYLNLFFNLYGLKYVALRISNPYGAGQLPGKGQGVIGEFVNRVLTGNNIDVYGDGSIVRDFVHISDVVDAMINAAENNVVGVLNIGSGKGVSINQLIEIIKSASGVDVTVNYLESRGFDVQNNTLSIEKAKKVLGWEPKIQLEDGIKKLINEFDS